MVNHIKRESYNHTKGNTLKKNLNVGCQIRETETSRALEPCCCSFKHLGELPVVRNSAKKQHSRPPRHIEW